MERKGARMKDLHNSYPKLNVWLKSPNISLCLGILWVRNLGQSFSG